MAGTTGKVTGLITDKETGEPLIGCNVIIMETDLGTASNEDGEYFILNIPCMVKTLRCIILHNFMVTISLVFEKLIKEVRSQHLTYYYLK